MPHRIVLIIPTLDRGGAEKQLVLLAKGLPRDRFDVHVCLLTRSGPLESELRQAEIPVALIGKRRKFDPRAYGQLKRYLKQTRPDLVHTWLFAANSYGRMAARAARVPVVVGGERCEDPWKSWWQLAIDRYLARRTARLITNSVGVRDFYAARGVAAERFEVIPNGISVPHEFPERGDSTLRDELGLPDSSRLIGAIGRLWPQKRIKDLIWATDLIQCVRDDTHLLIVGEGPLRSELEKYATQVHVDRRVHFLGQRDDVPTILRGLDCLWLASGYEGQSNAILEAMAAAVPVVATDIAGNRDLVRQGETGFLVAVGDRAAFATRTRQLLENDRLAERMGTAGYERARDEFSVERMVDRHAELYERLISEAP